MCGAASRTDRKPSLCQNRRVSHQPAKTGEKTDPGHETSDGKICSPHLSKEWECDLEGRTRADEKIDVTLGAYRRLWRFSRASFEGLWGAG